jgi:hypothetical protein
MAGFGAGFGKAFGGSLDAAGKLYQQEQMRSREYERAKADRQAERLQDRAWQKEDKKEEAEAEAEKDTFRYFEKDGKFYYTRTDGTVVERPAGDHGVNRFLQWRTEQKRATDTHNLNMRKGESSIAADAAQIRAADASRRASAKQIESSKTMDTFAESLAKNKKVFTRSSADLASFTRILGTYGFKNGADLGREYMNNNSRAIEAMNLAQDHLYFPEASELNDSNKLKVIR